MYSVTARSSALVSREVKREKVLELLSQQLTLLSVCPRRSKSRIRPQFGIQELDVMFCLQHRVVLSQGPCCVDDTVEV